MKHKKIGSLLGSILCLWLLILQDGAIAQEEFSDEDPFTDDEESLLFDEIPSVYSASKYDQKVTKAPSSISIVTADEIKKYGYRTFGDILASLRGFYHTNDRNYGYVGVRGFGLPSDFNTRLLLLIDGHRFNDNIYDSFDSLGAFPLDIDTIKRVEVVRGPGSSLYGTSAFFGVINVITKRGRDLEGANIAASYGSFDAYKTRLSYGNRFDSGLEMFLSGTFFDSQGDDHLYFKEFDAPETNNGVYVNNDEEQRKKIMGTISFQDFTLHGLYMNRDKEMPTASYETVFNDPAANTKEEAGYLELKYDHTFENQLNLQSRLSYNHYRYRGDYPYDYSEDDTPDIVLSKDLSQGSWWRAELEATKTLWEHHRITIGGEYQDNFHQYLTNYDDFETYIEADETSDKWAIFIQDEFSITDAFTFSTGVRYDYFSTFGDTINPRAALIYNPFESTSVKLLYGTAFRAPNASELNYNDGGNSQIGSENLQPEELETIELVFEHYFDRHLRAELNLFHTDITDIISIATVDDEVLQIQNKGDVETLGAEIQLEGSWDNGLKGRISYAWQETERKETGERLTNSPEHLVKLNLIAPLWADKLFTGLETQYMSGRKTPSGGRVGDHVVTNLTLLTQNWAKGLELLAGVYNLFDEEYFDPGSEQHTQNGIEQDGVTFRVKASLEF